MPELHRGQFGELAGRLDEPDSGFSVSMRGKEPTSGFMVSQKGTERYVAPGESVEHHLASYASEHEASLSRPGRYLGGWRDPIHGNVDLDISRRYTSHDRGRAAMWAENQDALFNLHRGSSEHNFAKLGTEGTTVGEYIDEPPMKAADYQELQRAARQRLHSRRP